MQMFSSILFKSTQTQSISELTVVSLWLLCNLMSSVTPIKEVHSRCPIASWPNDLRPGDEQFSGRTKQHMAARLFLADTTDRGKAAPLPTLQFLQADRRDFLKPRLLQKPRLGRVVWNSWGGVGNRHGPDALKTGDLKKLLGVFL